MTTKDACWTLLVLFALSLGMELGYKIHQHGQRLTRRPSYPGNVPGVYRG